MKHEVRLTVGGNDSLNYWFIETIIFTYDLISIVPETVRQNDNDVTRELECSKTKPQGPGHFPCLNYKIRR